MVLIFPFPSHLCVPTALNQTLFDRTVWYCDVLHDAVRYFIHFLCHVTLLYCTLLHSMEPSVPGKVPLRYLTGHRVGYSTLLHYSTLLQSTSLFFFESFVT